jgi:glycosyltransferase involved in cell wall biosynthesis
MKRPKVSVGLPVYNGEKYLAKAIESVLAQTFTDLELIISDNASTDNTRQICEHYAARDQRIHYYRHEVNHGATWNFNRAFELSSGTYFNWLAHDDMLAPDFLMRCVEVLENVPEVVLCFSNARIVDENNEQLDRFDFALRTDSSIPGERFYDLLMVWHDCLPIFGLIRASSLKKTPLIGSYASGDHVLLARLGLMGKFEILPEYLFLSRRHPLQSNKVYNVWTDHHAYSRWFSENQPRRLFLPQWEIMRDYFSMINRAEISWRERAYCHLALGRWALRYRKLLWKDWAIIIRNNIKVPKVPSFSDRTNR